MNSMKNRLFFWFTVLFLAGIFLAAEKWFLPAALIFAGILALSFLLKTYGFFKVCMAALVGILAGFFCFSAQLYTYTKRILPLDGKNITIEGRVEEVRIGEKYRLTVRGTGECFSKTYENIAVYVYPKETSFSYGDTVSLTGPAYIPALPDTFVETNYRYTCMEKGIYASVYPEKGQVIRTGHDVSLFRPKDAAHLLRAQVFAGLRGLSPQAEGFLRAFLGGDRSLLTPEDKELLRLSGLSHIVAVSGLHLQIVVGAFVAMMGLLRIKRRWFSILLYLLVTWFFVLFSGSSASVLRAALMMTVFFLGDFFRRDQDSITALSAAIFFLCLANPALLFSVGFQLSVSATAGLVFFANRFRAYLFFFPRFLRTTFSAAVAAFLGAAPVCVYHFGTLSVFGFFANLLVCPILGILMGTGFLGTMLSAVPFVSPVLFFVCEVLISYIFKVAAFFASLPFATMYLPSPSLLQLIGYFSVLAGLTLFLKKKRLRGGLAVCLCLVLLITDTAVSLFARPKATVTFFGDNGGDCVLVEINTRAYLFDCGSSFGVPDAAADLVSSLLKKGIETIDGAFLSSYAACCAGSMAALLESGLVETVFLPYYEDMKLKPALAAAAYLGGTRIRYLGDGDTVAFEELSVAALDGAAGKEDGGLIYSVSVNEKRLLLPGAMGESGLWRLVSRGADLDCDFLKLPATFGEMENKNALFDAATPALCVLPEGNSVSPEGRKNTISLYSIEEHGAVQIAIAKDGAYTIKTVR